MLVQVDGRAAGMSVRTARYNRTPLEPEATPMFARLMPREERFFDDFNAAAARVVEGARELAALMGDINQLGTRLRRIEALEREADTITQGALQRLQQTFITPLDRDVIHALATRIDDILDVAEAAAQTVYEYDVQRLTPEAKELADLCLEAAVKVREALALLHDLKNGERIRALAQEVGVIEDRTDQIMRAAMARLFRDEPEVRQVMKLRAVYERLEDMADRCYVVARLLDGVVLENS